MGASFPSVGASSKPVTLSGVGSYDPHGDGEEHSTEAGEATDKDIGTAWSTESYRPGGFSKDGVGLVLQAPRAAGALEADRRRRADPFSATIQASDSPTGGFVNVSGTARMSPGRPTFSVDTDGKDYGYYMVWLKLPTGEGQAEINEVTART